MALSPNFDLWSPDTGTEYKPAIDLAAMQDSVDAALLGSSVVPVSSEAERNSVFPSPENGAKVYRGDVGYIEIYWNGWRPAHWGTAPSAPPYADRGLLRSDGQLAFNGSNITTAMTWTDIGGTANTLGVTFGQDANGAFFTVPKAGLYRVTVFFLISGNGWAGVSINGFNSSLAYSRNEANLNNSFGSTSADGDFFLNPGTKVWFPFSAANSGSMREPGRVKVRPIY